MGILVPIYVCWLPWLQTIAYAANGVSPVEPNPEFVAQMKAVSE
jgi:hypothetical protein